ncbi:MAG: PorT family protein [Phaeodactylibacter sp.]|nr:PorT family protein [Phaeodactylibacter sp.]MCB9301391.1 PorT family protein [Lewinellaceae bacterium]HQU59296.1 porin family protein [Saprospiraceae bacterium]
MRDALFIFLFIICSSILSGQTYFGLKAGGNISHFQMTKIPSQYGDVNLGQIYGYQAGLVLEQPINRHLALGAELLFSQKGGQWTLAPYGSPGLETEISRLQYLNLPVFLRLIPIERWSVDLGMEGSYLLVSPDERLFMERADFSWLAGATFHITSRLHASLRYLVGAVRVGEGAFRDEETGIQGVYYFRTRSLQLSIAWFW